VVCVLSAVLHGTHFTHHNTAKLITMYFYWLILQKYNFSKAQRKLREDGPDWPKHVGANIEIF
jgi:membrane-associated PAP2 superfamily phosphatase